MKRKFALLTGIAALAVAALPATASAACNDVAIFSGPVVSPDEGAGTQLNTGANACSDPVNQDIHYLTPGSLSAYVGVYNPSIPAANGTHTFSYGNVTTPLTFREVTKHTGGTRWESQQIAIDPTVGGSAVASVTMDDGSVVTNTFNSFQGRTYVTTTRRFATVKKARKAKKARRTRR